MARLLVEDGWQVRAQNWRGGGGELDLVVQRGRALRFVEVKARAGSDRDPLESLTAGKRAKLAAAADAWVRAHAPDVDEQAFLVAVVDLGATPWAVTWLDDAFDGS